MAGFMLDRVPAITQAPGALDQVGALAARLSGGRPALLVADPGLAPFGIIARAEASLRAAGLVVMLHDDIRSDPTAAQVDAAAALARRGEAGVVIALGGGSAMDAGKAAAAIAPAAAPATHYALCANPLPVRPLPKICVPTTSGTGSETTRTAIVADASGAKLWLWGDEIKADAVLLDPTLTTFLPPHLTAATGIDALVHAIEASTNANATEANDVYAHAAIRLVVRHLPAALDNPADLAARAGLQFAAALAGIAIDNCGTAIAHNIGHALASLRPVHHGRAVGLAMLATLPWNTADDPDGRFAAVAACMGEAADAACLPAAYERLLRTSRVKVALAGEGHDAITPAALAAQMAREENAAMRRSNRRPSTEADLLDFARAVLAQILTAMQITAIEITQHRLTFAPPFRASWDSKPRHHWDATIVRVRTDAGITGIGSGDLMLGFAGHEHLFVGADPLAIERHYRTLSHLAFHYGRCWPLDLALWDLAGKAAGMPCWKLLGGLSDRVRAYASSGTLRDPGAMAEAAERYLAQGFRALKIRFQRGDWRDDIRALEAVRARLGDRLELMVDCNQGWRLPQDTYPPWSLKDAVTVARHLERLGVYWMEEPLHRGDRAGMRRLREMVDVRIAGGEMTRDLYEFRDLITEGCLDVVQPDAALVGGITGLRRVALMAQEHGLVFTPHTWGNGIGLIANAHLTCGLADAPYLEFPFDPPEWDLDRRDYMLAEPCRVDADGFVVLGEAPGMGFELDEARLEKTRIA